MKRFLIACVAVALFSAGCQNPPQQNNVSIENDAPAGFDVNKLAQLVKTSTNPQVLEKAINDPKNQINNLDLDKDGNIDYLKVEEPAQNQLKVVDDVNASDSVTVAKINVTPNNAASTADLSIQGNPNYVGNNNYYQSSFPLTDFLLLSYFLAPHPYYMPMYHYGYYPSYYSRVHTVTTFRTTTSPAMSSRISNRSSLGSPNRSQRSFGTRNTSSPVRSGGFGSGSSHSSGFGSSRSSGRSFGRSGGGFGRRR
jgi:uncharacterized membrane protein YgcG